MKCNTWESRKENVLLIDGDLRCPDICKKLGFKTQYGLSHYLRNQVDLETIIYKTNIPKLSVIPAGDGSKRHLFVQPR